MLDCFGSDWSCLYQSILYVSIPKRQQVKKDNKPLSTQQPAKEQIQNNNKKKNCSQRARKQQARATPAIPALYIHKKRKKNYNREPSTNAQHQNKIHLGMTF